ncbi:MAG: hypothetical protein J7647_32210 [Cyanobacteria bacterium SBLK]|nr:hypothetical protein [Cyanobacteria bacterium SBLK]
MPKIEQCDRCLFYSRSVHVICSIHPYGVEGNECLDFRENPNLQAEDRELWAPQGYSWYGDELVSHAPPRYTPEQQLELLDTHPFFTGICPQCGHKFDRDNLPRVHWDCPSCGWMDDTIH